MLRPSRGRHPTLPKDGADVRSDDPASRARSIFRGYTLIDGRLWTSDARHQGARVSTGSSEDRCRGAAAAAARIIPHTAATRSARRHRASPRLPAVHAALAPHQGAPGDGLRAVLVEHPAHKPLAAFDIEHMRLEIPQLRADGSHAFNLSHEKASYVHGDALLTPQGVKFVTNDPSEQHKKAGCVAGRL